jgi:hypothetical protein
MLGRVGFQSDGMEGIIDLKQSKYHYNLKTFLDFT